MPLARSNADHSPAPRGFTLTELMVVLTIVAAMTAMSVPSFQRAIEQSRADIAAANLRAIWAAERLYWLENQTYTTNLTTLRDSGVLDKEIVDGAGGYTYEVTAATATAFTATAARAGESQWSGTLTISADGAVTGALTTSGGGSITPGFQ